MPESVIQDKYVSQIRSFALPPELTNKPAETPKAEVTPPATPPEAPVKADAPDGEKEPALDKEPTEAAVSEEAKPEPEEAKRRRENAQRRIAEKTIRQRAELQAKNEQLERELNELRAKSQPPASTGRPKMEDFTDISEFEKAVDKHAREEAIKEYEKKRSEETQKQTHQKLVNTWEASVAKNASKFDDFEETVGDLKPTEVWSMAIMSDDEMGPDIAYYLGKHPKEAQRIFALDQISQVREIGKLSVKLQAPAAPKTPSKAPPPIAPVTGTAASGEKALFDPQSPEEYMKKGNKFFRGR